MLSPGAAPGSSRSHRLTWSSVTPRAVSGLGVCTCGFCMRGKLQVRGCNSPPEDDALSAIRLSFGEDASSFPTARAAPASHAHCLPTFLPNNAGVCRKPTFRTVGAHLCISSVKSWQGSPVRLGKKDQQPRGSQRWKALRLLRSVEVAERLGCHQPRTFPPSWFQRH